MQNFIHCTLLIPKFTRNQFKAQNMIAEQIPLFGGRNNKCIYIYCITEQKISLAVEEEEEVPGEEVPHEEVPGNIAN